MNRAWVVPIAWCLGALSGCTIIDPTTRDCILSRRCTDGGVCPLTEAEAQAMTDRGIDLLSFGSTDCDDLTCVRDASFPKGVDATRPALGYCSRACSEGSSCATSLDKNLATDLRCRALHLEPADAGNSPFYCARGG